MRVFFDTSVLVAALVREHPRHERAFDRLRRVRSGSETMLTSAHTLAELFAVLTTLPVSPRIAPGAAARLIGESVEVHAQIVTLAVADYRETVRRIGDLGLSGGIVYDALACCAAVRASADLLLTFNSRDFRRAWPEIGAMLEEP